MNQQERELMHKSAEMVSTLTAALNDAAKRLREAAQTITEKDSLIEHLSKDNLALVAKLDALTGKTAPGTGFSA